MDPRQFDRLARMMLTQNSRRELWRRAVSAFAILSAWRTRRASAQADCPGGCAADQVCVNGGCVRPCANHRDCRSKRDDPCILNQCLDGVCVEAIVDCMPGYECCEGSCCPRSCEQDDECTVLDPCRWGACGAGGQCEFTERDPCVICASDLECQDGSPNTVCCGGACQRPCPSGTVMGKGCECRADASGTLDGLVVRDDASGE